MDSTTPRGLSPAWADFLRAERVRLERLGLRRSVVTPERRGGVHATLGGRDYVAFTSNDYLGLATRPEVIDAANAAASLYGTGAGSARLLHGHEGGRWRTEVIVFSQGAAIVFLRSSRREERDSLTELPRIAELISERLAAPAAAADR